MKNSAFYTRAKTACHGFTIVEVVIVLAVMGILGSMAYSYVSGASHSAESTKLASDVRLINNAIPVYQSFGGSIVGEDDANSVLQKLQSQRTTDSANVSMGLSGRFIDQRITAVWQTEDEASTGQERAVWNGQRFEIVTSGDAGIKEFLLDAALAAEAPATEVRADMMLASDKSSLSPRWVWDYVDSNPGAIMGADVPATQNFESGFWTVGATGQVDVSYVFREAGYASRLALFSLEGMGADVYDLDTAEGQKAFLEEALRRVVEQDRAQVIIDASANQVGYNNSYTFRPGDTVAAILIPNTSFQDAYNQLQNDSTNSQTYPLTSLSRYGTNQAPFYANQYAVLGNGTNAYAIEDISTAGSSDNDYQDLIFKAMGLEQPGNSFPNTIDDPVAFFRQDPYWNVSISGRPTLRESLIAAGIIPATTPI